MRTNLSKLVMPNEGVTSIGRQKRSENEVPGILHFNGIVEPAFYESKQFQNNATELVAVLHGWNKLLHWVSDELCLN